MSKKTVIFNGVKCFCKQGKYPGSKAIFLLLIEIETGEQYARCTLNLPKTKIKEGEDVIIKSYAENFGMHDALVTAGVIKKYHRAIEVGHTYALICKFLGI